MRTLKDLNILIEKEEEKTKKKNKNPEDPTDVVTQDDEDKTLEDPELDTDRKPNLGDVKSKSSSEPDKDATGKPKSNVKEAEDEVEDAISDDEVEDILDKIEAGEIADPDIDSDDDEEEDEDSEWAEYVELGEHQDWDELLEAVQQLDEGIIRKRVFRRDRKTGAIKRVLKLVSSNPRAKIVKGREKMMSATERRKRAIAGKRRGRKKGLMKKASRRAKMTRKSRLGMKG